MIVDLMAKWPRLNLDSSYFLDSYAIEIEHLKLWSKLVREILDYQIWIENEVN